MVEGYSISTNVDEMNVALIHGFLVKSYWAKGIPMHTLVKSIANSLCFAVLDSQNQQVGFARVITDKATHAYLADVFILEGHRGQGLSKMLLTSILKHSELQGLRKILLATADAHDLYKLFDFKLLAKPDTFMEKWDPDVYLKG